MTEGRRAVMAAALALALLLVGSSFFGYSSLATAGTIGISGSTLIIGAEPADGDVVLVGSVSGTDFLLVTADSFDIVTAGRSGNGVISCPLSGFTSLIAFGSTGDDTLDFSALTFGAILAGGDGNDTILGTPFDDVIFGDAGDDVLLGNSGDDVILGGPGIDVLDGGSGDNILIQDGEGSSGFEPLPRPTQIPAPGSLSLLLAAFIALALRKTFGECT